MCGNHSVEHALTVGHLKKENKWSLKNWLKKIGNPIPLIVVLTGCEQWRERLVVE